MPDVRSGFGNTGRRGSDFGSGYKVRWNGGKIVEAAQLAALSAINDVVETTAELARASHIWDNRSGQTEAAVFSERARIEDGGTWVWGHWGVRERPRIDDRTGRIEKVSTVDVALFLEFGTSKMMARPWLYPAYDATKYTLGPVVKAKLEIYFATLRDARGRATSAPGWTRVR